MDGILQTKQVNDSDLVHSLWGMKNNLYETKLQISAEKTNFWDLWTKALRWTH